MDKSRECTCPAGRAIHLHAAIQITCSARILQRDCMANHAMADNANKPPLQFTESGRRILGAGTELAYSNSGINQGKASECPTARARQVRDRGKVT